MSALVRRSGFAGAFGRRVALLAGGTMLGRAITLLAAPVLTRLYSPEDFGVLAVFGALLGISATVACLRYELAIPLPSRARTAAALLILCFISSISLSLLFVPTVWLLGEAIAARLNVPQLAPYLWLLPIGLLCVGSYQALSYWAIRTQAFRLLARTRVSQGLGQVVVQLGWGFTVGGPAGLLAGAVVGQAGGLTTLAAGAYRDRKFLGRRSLRSLRWAMRRYRRFPLLATGSALLNSGVRQLPALLLAAIYGAQVAGWYSLSHRILAAPMILLGSAVAQVYVSEIPRLLREDPQRLRTLFLRLTWRLIGVGTILLGGIGLAGGPIFKVVFGEAWEPAGLFAQILVLNYLGQFVVGTTAQTLNVMERQDLHLLWNAIQLVIILVIFWAAGRFEWPPVWLIGAYSIAMLASYVALFVLALRLITRRIAAARGRTLKGRA